mmetsp:Transcript_101476/g.295710  ORF Transcript_101476/g.295710 Transcript_101476/m.295710 type:complete len:201 (-) Transcript_101476:1150-1752(-)
MAELLAEFLVEGCKVLRIQMDVHDTHSPHRLQFLEDRGQFMLRPHLKPCTLIAASSEGQSQQVVVPVLDVIVRPVLAWMDGALGGVAGVVENKERRIAVVLDQRGDILGRHLKGTIPQQADQASSPQLGEAGAHQAAEARADGCPIPISKHLHAHGELALRCIDHAPCIAEQDVTWSEVLGKHQHHSVNAEFILRGRNLN